jgi:rod shape determining protein RodA
MSLRMAGPRLRQADPIITIAAIGLTALGVLLVTSATWQYFEDPSLIGNTWFVKQILFAVVGLALMIACAFIHPKVLHALAYPIYGLSLLGLVAVLFLGHGSAEYGAQRWIEVAGVPLQPSEATKVAMVVVLARVFAGRTPGLTILLYSAALVALPVALIYLQPDLGTALVLIATWAGMVFFAGTPKRYLFGIVGLAAIAMPIIWLGLKDYMRQRVMIFLNPQADPLDQGYNILQAQISIGAGGMWGKGLLEGTQTQLRYLRVSHSDFIFSVLGEELGFIGAIVLFALFLFLLFRILHSHDIANDRFSGLLCAGVGSMIAFQAVANLGANVGMTPVVGIPLPFVSYGGSALVTQLAALGLVQATLIRRRRYRFEA